MSNSPNEEKYASPSEATQQAPNSPTPTATAPNAVQQQQAPFSILAPPSQQPPQPTHLPISASFDPSQTNERTATPVSQTILGRLIGITPELEAEMNQYNRERTAQLREAIAESNRVPTQEERIQQLMMRPYQSAITRDQPVPIPAPQEHHAHEQKELEQKVPEIHNNTTHIPTITAQSQRTSGNIPAPIAQHPPRAESPPAPLLQWLAQYLQRKPDAIPGLQLTNQVNSQLPSLPTPNAPVAQPNSNSVPAHFNVGTNPAIRNGIFQPHRPTANGHVLPPVPVFPPAPTPSTAPTVQLPRSAPLSAAAAPFQPQVQPQPQPQFPPAPRLPVVAPRRLLTKAELGPWGLQMRHRPRDNVARMAYEIARDAELPDPSVARTSSNQSHNLQPLEILRQAGVVPPPPPSNSDTSDDSSDSTYRPPVTRLPTIRRAATWIQPALARTSSNRILPIGSTQVGEEYKEDSEENESVRQIIENHAFNRSSVTDPEVEVRQHAITNSLSHLNIRPAEIPADLALPPRLAASFGRAPDVVPSAANQPPPPPPGGGDGYYGGNEPPVPPPPIGVSGSGAPPPPPPPLPPGASGTFQVNIPPAVAGDMRPIHITIPAQSIQTQSDSKPHARSYHSKLATFQPTQMSPYEYITMFSNWAKMESVTEDKWVPAFCSHIGDIAATTQLLSLEQGSEESDREFFTRVCVYFLKIFEDTEIERNNKLQKWDKMKKQTDEQYGPYCKRYQRAFTKVYPNGSIDDSNILRHFINTLETDIRDDYRRFSVNSPARTHQQLISHIATLYNTRDKARQRQVYLQTIAQAIAEDKAHVTSHLESGPDIDTNLHYEDLSLSEFKYTDVDSALRAKSALVDPFITPPFQPATLLAFKEVSGVMDYLRRHHPNTVPRGTPAPMDYQYTPTQRRQPSPRYQPYPNPKSNQSNQPNQQNQQSNANNNDRSNRGKRSRADSSQPNPSTGRLKTDAHNKAAAPRDQNNVIDLRNDTRTVNYIATAENPNVNMHNGLAIPSDRGEGPCDECGANNHSTTNCPRNSNSPFYTPEAGRFFGTGKRPSYTFRRRDAPPNTRSVNMIRRESSSSRLPKRGLALMSPSAPPLNHLATVKVKSLPPAQQLAFNASPQHEITVPLILRDCKVDAMLDTGCNDNIMTKRFYNFIPEKDRPPIIALGQPLNLVTANNQRMTIHGIVEINTAFLDEHNGAHYSHVCTFYVVSELPVPVIIGMDTAIDLMDAIDFRHRRPIFSSTLIPDTPSTPSSFGVESESEVPFPLHPTKAVLLRPHTVTRIGVTWNGFPTIYPGFSSPRDHHHSYRMESSIFHNRNGETIHASFPDTPVFGSYNSPDRAREQYVYMRNPTDRPITLIPSHPIGIVKPIVKLNGIQGLQQQEEELDRIVAAIQPVYEIEKPTVPAKPQPSSPIKPATEFDINPDLSPTDRQCILQVLEKYRSVFMVKESCKASIAHEVEHHITLVPNAKLTKCAPYRASPANEQFIRETVQSLLEQGFIQPSSAPSCSPVLVVPKKDGRKRMCVDFRALNKNVVKDSYPIPLINDCLARLKNAKWLTLLDLKNAFHHIRIAKKDRPLTAFVTKDGLWEWIVMTFGHCNAPATFQRYMEVCLGPHINIRCVVYFDDIVVHSSGSIEDHANDIALVLDSLLRCNLTVEIKKCHFAYKSLHFLGHIVEDGTIRPDPEKIKAVEQFPTPHDLTSLRSFLGLANYYRQFIDGFSIIAKPLYRLTRKNVNWEWTDDCIKAFDKLKAALVSSQCLYAPDFTQTFTVMTDASENGLGAVLVQKFDDAEHPVAYWSSQLTPAQQKYHTTDLECLAVINAVKHWEHYLIDRPFTIVTDHSALKALPSKANLNRRLARAASYLSQFHYSIEHRKGSSNAAADALSRNPLPDTTPPFSPLCFLQRRRVVWIRDRFTPIYTQAPQEVMAPVPTLPRRLVGPISRDHAEPYERRILSASTHSQADNSLSYYEFTIEDDSVRSRLIHEQKNDPTLEPIFKFIRDRQLPAQFSTIQKRQLQAECKNYFISSHDGALYYTEQSSYAKKLGSSIYNARLVIPLNYRKELIQIFHDSPFGGHLGITRTHRKLVIYYYWPGMYNDINNYVLSCPICQREKIDRNRHPRALHMLETPTLPFQIIASDIIGPLPKCADFTHIITIVDLFSKYAIAIPLMNTRANTIVEIMMKEVFCKFGSPEIIVTDNGTNYVSALFRAMSEMFGCQHNKCTAYHPQSNGAVERFNGSLKAIIGTLSDPIKNDWLYQLPYAVFAYNSSAHESTGISPFRLAYSFEPRVPTAPAPSSANEPAGDRPAFEFINEQYQFMTQAKKSVAEYYEKLKARRTQEAADAPPLRTYKVGDIVYLKRQPVAMGHSSSALRRPYTGDYVITSVISDLVYTIQPRGKPNAKITVVNVDRLRPARQSDSSLQAHPALLPSELGSISIPQPAAHYIPADNASIQPISAVDVANGLRQAREGALQSALDCARSKLAELEAAREHHRLHSSSSSSSSPSASSSLHLASPPLPSLIPVTSTPMDTSVDIPISSHANPTDSQPQPSRKRSRETPSDSHPDTSTPSSATSSSEARSTRRTLRNVPRMNYNESELLQKVPPAHYASHSLPQRK